LVPRDDRQLSVPGVVSLLLNRPPALSPSGTHPLHWPVWLSGFLAGSTSARGERRPAPATRTHLKGAADEPELRMGWDEGGGLEATAFTPNDRLSEP